MDSGFTNYLTFFFIQQQRKDIVTVLSFRISQLIIGNRSKCSEKVSQTHRLVHYMRFHPGRPANHTRDTVTTVKQVRFMPAVNITGIVPFGLKFIEFSLGTTKNVFGPKIISLSA